MQRGESRTTVAVVGLLAVIGVLAVLALFVKQPTGKVMQDQSVYVTVDQEMVTPSCQKAEDRAIFLGYTGNYMVFCCPEDMSGQNECKYPKRVLMTRTY